MNPTLLTKLGHARADWLNGASDAWHQYLACLRLVAAVASDAGGGAVRAEGPEVTLAGVQVQARRAEGVTAGDGGGPDLTLALAGHDAAVVGEILSPTLTAPPEVAWVAKTRRPPTTPMVRPVPSPIEWHPHPDRVLGLTVGSCQRVACRIAPAPAKTRRETASSRTPLADWMKLALRRSAPGA